ncbi:XK-related protein 8-like [Cheilinus undulatus]|uniref:XK-related protein 8-like n=1 Tax=Cheilinus undulatus TaxID=241271 RepID=UPI001BD34C14|nr:XK-related protein 8-like [Cheilinus undulatus]
MGVFKYSPVDFVLTCLGLIFLLLDIALDVWAVVSLYQEKAYGSLGVLVLFLVGSSVLVQAFSWLWFSYENFKMETTVGKDLTKRQLKVLHVLQLGIYFRHAGVVEVSVRSFFSKMRDLDEGVAVFLSHDLSMLRLIETFSESAPQLVLMLTIILQRSQLDPWTVLKAIGSASAIACSVTMYHRSLRSFLPKKEEQLLVSSVVYFLWNLLLIMSRITALALFASVLPCFIFTHFFCSWLVLFVFVWRSKTNFMDSTRGEWLYRVTVGIIWYFDWFSVVDGRTRYRTLLYHGYILVDISLLCGLWCWKMITEPTYYEILPLYAIITAVSVVVVYIFGLFLKMVYYKCCHPNIGIEELKEEDAEAETETSPTESLTAVKSCEDEVDFGRPAMVEDGSTETGSGMQNRIGASPPAATTKRCNKRMKQLAQNFYS